MDDHFFVVLTHKVKTYSKLEEIVLSFISLLLVTTSMLRRRHL
jgi:hypothetical protein